MVGHGFRSVPFTLLSLLLLILCSLRTVPCHARGTRHWRHRGKGHKNGHSQSHGQNLIASRNYVGADLASAPTTSRGDSSEITFSVLDHGAKGDGQTDDTKAFEATWAAACQVRASTVQVPQAYVFLIGPISFSGANCASNIVFQIDGTIVAPTSSSSWGKGLLEWIQFMNVQGIKVQGDGTIDGQGAVWWSGNKMPKTKPTALRFYGSTDVTVTGITIQNSPQTHLKFDSCTTVLVHHFTASSPGTSPNTDGIHLQNSQKVLIYSCTLACGDDCVSIQTGCSNVNIHDISCGPGHGISIGSLGSDNTKACVSNITVRDTTMTNTASGIRIKTWQGGSGSVEGIIFSNIQVSGVQTPIVIDQFYCDGGKCKNSSSAVAISGVQYASIRGTYTTSPVHIACSDGWPCTGISMDTIELKPEKQISQPFCSSAYGQLVTSTVPPINCLKSGSSKKQALSC